MVSRYRSQLLYVLFIYLFVMFSYLLHDYQTIGWFWYIQGPVYVGTGCMFRRFALYGFDPPEADTIAAHRTNAETETLKASDFDPDLDMHLLPKRFGNSTMLAESIPIAEFQGRPLADHPAVKYGRPPGALRVPREPLDATTVAEAVSVISCWYVFQIKSDIP